MPVDIEGTLEWSNLVEDDLQAVAELREAIEYIDDPAEHRGLSQLWYDFHLPWADATRNAVVGRDQAGTIVAYAWNRISPADRKHPQVWIDQGVHPAWRHKRIGKRLLEWQIERATRWYAEIAGPDTGDGWLNAAVDERLTVARRRLEVVGMTPTRWYFDEHRSLVGELPPRQPISGVELVPFSQELSEAVRVAHNESFDDTLGSRPVNSADWQASLKRPDARPQWSWVALSTEHTECADGHDHGTVVAYAINSISGDHETAIGWTERLGTCPAWRGRGIGKQLLIASMESFREAGLEMAGVGVDTDDPEAAGRLFSVIGYQPTDRVVAYGVRFNHTGILDRSG